MGSGYSPTLCIARDKMCSLRGEIKVCEVKWFSHVRLFATPWTVAYHASPAMGFSRQELEWVAINKGISIAIFSAWTA